MPTLVAIDLLSILFLPHRPHLSYLLTENGRAKPSEIDIKWLFLRQNNIFFWKQLTKIFRNWELQNNGAIW